MNILSIYKTYSYKVIGKSDGKSRNSLLWRQFVRAAGLVGAGDKQERLRGGSGKRSLKCGMVSRVFCYDGTELNCVTSYTCLYSISMNVRHNTEVYRNCRVRFIYSITYLRTE